MIRNKIKKEIKAKKEKTNIKIELSYEFQKKNKAL